jgi:hypothetical protein
VFLEEMNRVTKRHLAGCPEYARIWPGICEANSTTSLPYLHVGIFKHVLFRTRGEGIDHSRTLLSSATTQAQPSQIALDQNSSTLQAQSSLAILKDLVGSELRPLLVLDDSRALRQRGQVSARIAAAMALRPLATEIQFLLEDADDPSSLRWSLVRDLLGHHDDILVYGFTWILWSAWADGRVPADVRSVLRGRRIHFVHSGGWKKLEASAVTRERFDSALLDGLDPRSRVVDFYGLVEQVGVIFPLCDRGARHVPRWAEVVVRDPWTLAPLATEMGLLQFLNPLALGAPYHSVLTEDLGRQLPGECPCGRSGRRFELLGRVPKAEVRGCANV